MKHIVASILCFFLLQQGHAQQDSTHVIRVHFLYGSKPRKAYKSSEARYFGGIHGGHVSIEYNHTDFGFEPSNGFHVFAHRHRYKSKFVSVHLGDSARYGTNRKTTTVVIPLSDPQYHTLVAIDTAYCQRTPYDYAFFGMRCAASAQEILGKLGILKQRKLFGHVLTAFYPKRLRKRILKLAAEKRYMVIRQEGRASRRWEKD